MTMRPAVRNPRATSRRTPRGRKKDRDQVAQELPSLIARNHQKLTTIEHLYHVLQQLKAARKERKLRLSDIKRLTGMNVNSLSRLEIGKNLNPCIDTLVRYAEVLGKRVVISLADA